MANTMFNIGTGMTGGVMPNPISLSTIDLVSQFEQPKFVVSKNSLISQIMDYARDIEKKSSTNLTNKFDESVKNEYKQLYPEYDRPMSQTNISMGGNVFSIFTNRVSGGQKNYRRYRYPSGISVSDNKVPYISISLTNLNRYSYPKV